MTGLETATVIAGLIGIVMFEPTEIKLKENRLSMPLIIILCFIRNIGFLAMVILPLYFRYWR